MSGPLLDVRDLEVRFRTERGEARAVDGVSFELASAEIVGLVGESGCGKTTTALALLGLHPRPVARLGAGSSIRYRGEELVGAPAVRLRRLRGGEVAMIFQEPAAALNPVLTVGEQIGEALRMHRGMDRRAARAEATCLLEEVGIARPEARVDAYPHQLSGGMLQRVTIAMALAGEPSILVADEPTSALDVTVQARILDLLLILRERRGMAMLLVTHDLAVVAETCDRVLVMYAGQLVETGAAREVLGDPRHPYTRGLLASVPSVAHPGRTPAPVPGAVPDPCRWPPGCRFEPRCPHAAPVCLQPPEPSRLDAPGRMVRCARAGELSAVGEAAP